MAYVLRPVTDLIPAFQSFFPASNLPPFSDFLIFSSVVSGVLLVIFSFAHLYQLRTWQNAGIEFWRILLSVLVWGMAIISFFALVRHELFFSRVLLAQAMIFSLIFVFGERLILRGIQLLFFKNGIGRRRVLLIGSSDLTHAISREIDEGFEYELAGIVTFAQHDLPGDFTVGTISSLEQAVEEHVPDEIWLCEKHEKEREFLDFCQRSHLLFRWIPDTHDALMSRIEAMEFCGYPVLSVEPTPLFAWSKVAKRLVDFVAAGSGILVLLPVFALIGAAIKIDSDGPIFYKSLRIGRHKELFGMWKFRSMIVNADELKEALRSQNHRSDTPLFKVKNDPRVTSVGRFLRRWSLDELPQLFNVFLGEMSLVGPRAHLPDEVEKYEPHQLRVLTIKPGITGLAQASGRSDLPFAEEVRLDLFYIANWSFWLDLRILWKTVVIVFEGKGAD